MIPDSEFTASCPVCGPTSPAVLYRLEGAPVTCASLFATAAEAKAVPRGTLELVVCGSCGLVFNRAFSPSLAQIGAAYESSQAASGHFSAYTRSLAADWVGRYRLQNRTILEPGCGGGDFLVELLHAGAGRVIGIDPLAAQGPASIPPGKELELVASHFDDRQLLLDGDALVCRHTLEHIADVGGFLRSVWQWARRAPGRIVLFEVPASERIFSECAFWDIYYEHCNYFTEASLANAFARAGFRIERIVRTYDDQYLTLEAKPAAPPPTPITPVIDAQAPLLSFSRAAAAMIQRAASTIRDLKREGPVALWQGAAKSVGFLAALGDEELVDFAVDINPNRHNRFLPGTGLEIVAPQRLAALKPRHVILMNPVYYAEVMTTLRETAPGARLWTVNEICDGCLVSP